MKNSIAHPEFDGGKGVSKKMRQMQHKAEKVRSTNKKQVHVATSYINWQQVSNMFGYIKRTLERQSLSK